MWKCGNVMNLPAGRQVYQCVNEEIANTYYYIEISFRIKT